jgi:hypothetical protein
MCLRCAQFHPHMNSADDEDTILQIDFTHRFRDKAFVRCVDLTRLERASKGSGKSTGSRGNNVVQGCSVRFEHRWGHFVMFRHCAVDAEDHGRRLRGEICSAHGSFYPLDSDFGTVDYFCHRTHRHSNRRRSVRIPPQYSIATQLDQANPLPILKRVRV